VAKLLIEIGSPLDCVGSATSPLMEAAINGHTGVMRVLLESGVDLAEKGGEGGG
jgi:ankyrin repeat protein